MSIHAFPVEVLSLVFLSSPTRSQDLRDSTHLKLRFVCRFWRDIIDRTPQLWTQVVLRRRRVDPKQLQTLLKRSKGCALDLQVHVQSLAGIDGLVPVLLPAVARARFLSISCAPCNMHQDLVTREDWPDLYQRAMDVMHELLETPAPLLEELIINTLSLSVTSEMFGGLIPQKLRSVELVDCDIVPPTSCFFASPLTHLVIDFCASWESVDDMLSALTALPLLEHLRWDADAYPTPPPFIRPEARDPKSLSLPHLRYLNLCMDLDIILLVIPILDFPSSTTLIIAGELMDEPVEDTPPFINLLHTMRAVFQPHFRSVFSSVSQGFQRVSMLPYKENNRHGFNVILETPTGHCQGNSPARFEFGACFDSECQDEYLHMIQEVLRWPGISNIATHLNIDHEFFMRRASDWRVFLHAMPSIATINVHGPAAAPLIWELSALPEERVPNRELKININNIGPRVLGVILRALDDRVRLSLPPLEIGLHHCRMEFATFMQVKLHAGVKSVKWDGQSDGTLCYGDGENGGELVL